MSSYFLMHKNVPVLAFILEGSSVTNVRINEKARNHLPWYYGNNIQLWLNSRGIPVTRHGLKNDLKTNPFKLMLTNLGLSLSDCYWIKPVNSNLAWEEVNLYMNSFKDSFTLDITDNSHLSIVGRTNFLPSASLKGDLKKKWLIGKNGSRILVKGNYSDGCVQSLSEVLASRIYGLQKKIPFVEYNLIDISSNGNILTGCFCKNFTSENLELVHAYDIVSSFKKPNNMNYFQFYKSILKSNGVECDNFYDMQIMVDFIITNIDRHFNNFGILRDSNTLQFVCPAPVFDSGNSMFYKSSYVPVGRKLLDIDVTSFYSKEVKLLSQVDNRGLVDVRLLPDDNYVYTLLCKDRSLSEDRKERIVKAYSRKIEYFLDFQNGADIWSYNYVRSR